MSNLRATAGPPVCGITLCANLPSTARNKWAYELPELSDLAAAWGTHLRATIDGNKRMALLATTLSA